MTLQLLIFAAAFTASAAPPGPDTLTVFGRGLGGGLRAAGPFIAGVTLAKISLLSLALLGAAEVAQRFETAFVGVKFAGAGYLCFLGLKQLVRRDYDTQPDQVEARSPIQDLFVGLGLGVSNPHAVLFYVALVPTVVDVGTVSLAQYLALVAIVVTLWLVIAVAYAGLADRLRSVMRSRTAVRRVGRASGATMLGAGALVATR